MSKLRTTEIYLKLSCRALAFIKFFCFFKKSLELVSLPDFLHAFWRKIVLFLYFINWPNVIAWLPLFREILGNTYIVIVNQLDKNLNILRSKRAFKIKEKAFFIKFKGLSLKGIKKSFFGRWESDFNAKEITWPFERLETILLTFRKHCFYEKICNICSKHKTLKVYKNKAFKAHGNWRLFHSCILWE